MANYTFCIVKSLDGYQRVTGYEGEDLPHYMVVLACGHKQPLNAMTYGIDEVPDGSEPVPATVISVPIEAAIAASEALPAQAVWTDVVEHAQAAENTVTIQQTEVPPSA